MDLQQLIDKEIQRRGMNVPADEKALRKLRAEVLGGMIAHWAGWIGAPILIAFEEALTDANYHDFAEVVANRLACEESENEECD